MTTLAYKTIRNYIWDGRLDAGGRLTEEFLAQNLGISKSPIREALNRLESEGLIRIEPRRGAYLVQFTPEEVSDLYDVREALEAHAVANAKLTPETMNKLHESVARMREYFERNDKLRYIDEDVAFHALLAQAGGNVKLLRILENIQHQVWLFRRKTYDLSRSNAVQSHAEIVKALSGGDKQAAERLMREHIRGVKDRLIEYLRAQDHEPRRKGKAAVSQA